MARISTEYPPQLKKARKEGRLAEALLDRRSKLKRRVGSSCTMPFQTNHPAVTGFVDVLLTLLTFDIIVVIMFVSFPFFLDACSIM